MLQLTSRRSKKRTSTPPEPRSLLAPRRLIHKQHNSGRRLKLTKDLITEVDQLLTAGNYQETVRQYLGISHTTWYRWLQEGEAVAGGIHELHGEPIAAPELKRDLRDTVLRASMKSEVRNVANINRAALEEGEWRASAWFLERRFQDRWRPRVAVEGVPDAPIHLKVDYWRPGDPPAAQAAQDAGEGGQGDGGGSSG